MEPKDFGATGLINTFVASQKKLLNFSHHHSKLVPTFQNYAEMAFKVALVPCFYSNFSPLPISLCSGSPPYTMCLFFFFLSRCDDRFCIYCVPNRRFLFSSQQGEPQNGTGLKTRRTGKILLFLRSVTQCIDSRSSCHPFWEKSAFFSAYFLRKLLVVDATQPL